MGVADQRLTDSHTDRDTDLVTESAHTSHRPAISYMSSSENDVFLVTEKRDYVLSEKRGTSDNVEWGLSGRLRFEIPLASSHYDTRRKTFSAQQRLSDSPLSIYLASIDICLTLIFLTLPLQVLATFPKSPSRDRGSDR